jgi:thiopurine S-methyltransferase
MELSFWTSRWKKGKTGFHATEFNKQLVDLWPTFPLKKGSTVLVPLCGKSLDMIWLSQQGHKVIGIEISEIACRQLFEEHDINYHIRMKGGFTIYESESISLWQGDIFKMQASYLPKIHSVYDRAALVALPFQKRIAYINKILALLSSKTHIFLHSIEYDQDEMNGPPFSVKEDEIKTLFGEKYVIKCLEEKEILSQNNKFRRKGLSVLKEKIYHITC